MDNRRSGEIELKYIFGAILKRIWLVIILSVLFAVAGFGLARYTYVDQFTSTVLMLSNNKMVSNQTTTASDIQASQELANTYSAVLMSDGVIQKAIELSNYNVSLAYVREHTKISTYNQNNVMELSVTTDDSALSYALAQAFSDIAEGKEPIFTDMSIDENGASVITDRFLDNIVEMGTLTVFQYPAQAAAPDESNIESRNTIIGFLVGAALACIIIIMHEYMKSTVRFVSDVTDGLDMNILGVIPEVEVGQSRKREEKYLITNEKIGFDFIETYKSIRTKIEMYSLKHNCKKIIVASTLENEGKSTVSVNIAISLAQNGKKVILVDADLRNSTLHKLLSIENDEKFGLVAIANGSVAWRSAVSHVIGVENLDIIVSGDNTNDSAELLSSQRVADMFKDMSEEYEYVIIDTPPVHLLTDSAIIAGYADGIIMVVKQDFAKMNDIEMAIGDLKESCQNVIGCIINSAYGMNNSAGYSKGSYGYGYGYGHGHGYGYGHSYGDHGSGGRRRERR